jgi:hypothetical protein
MAGSVSCLVPDSDERSREEQEALDPEITPTGFAEAELLSSPLLRIHQLSEN